jgi:hypothetical protein
LLGVEGCRWKLVFGFLPLGGRFPRRIIIIIIIIIIIKKCNALKITFFKKAPK